MPTSEEVIRAARVLLSSPGKDIPNPTAALAPALWALRLVADEACPTMGVSKDWTLYYHPERVAAWPVKTVATALLHEIWHLLKHHHSRAEALGIMTGNSYAWNIAADAEINDGLIAAKYPFPPGIIPVTPTALNMPENLLAEEYYAKLPKQSQGGSDFGGSCSDGIRRVWEKDGGSAQQQGKQGAGRGQSAHVVPGELIRRQVAENIQQETSRSRGTMPGDWQKWAGAQLTPAIVPWQRVLRQVVGTIISAGKRDQYTYAKVNRRESLTPSFVLPGSYGTLPDLCVCLDSSGSMWNAVDECLAIVESALEHLGRTYPLTVLTGDTCVQSTSKVLSARNVDIRGGGGTDMRELITVACALKPRPQVVVVITDGYTPWPEAEPLGIQLVAVVITEEETPAWMTTVRVGKT